MKLVAVWITLVAAVVGGAVYLGELNGRINALNPEAIREARDQAIEEIRQQLPLDGNRFHRFELEVPDTDGTVTVSERLIPVESGICYLVDIRGNLQGAGDRLWIEPDNEYWVLRGHTWQENVEVHAGCWSFYPSED